jgi:multidrug efflux system membrane fusion protein
LPRQYQSPPDEPIGLLVAATRRRIKQAVGLRLRSHRLSPQQFWVLTVISEHEGRSLRELAGWQRLDEPTASRVVGNLTRQGLVRVDVDRGDRRRRSLVLTPKGRALARRLRPIALAVRAAIVAGLSTAEVRVLRAGLRKVIANMERFAQGSRGGAARVASGTRVALLAALLVVPGAACRRGAAAPPGAASVPVVVAAAVRRDVPVQIRAIGTVEPYLTVSIRPQVGGVVTAVHFAEGADVKAGDPLFTIEPRPYETALRQAESLLARDEANARNARAEAVRAEKLFGEGVLSSEQHEQLRSTAEASEAAARADRAAVDKARIDLGYCSIRSPIDGRTGTVLVHQGNLVKAIEGGPLVVINRMDPVYVSFAVPEQRLAEIKGARAAGRLVAEAQMPSEPSPPARGELSFLDNAVDRGTGTIRLKATFPNRDRRLWPGQFVTTRLTLGTREGAIVVPSQAIQSGQSGTFVFVVKPDLTAEVRPVSVAGDRDGETTVEKGLQPDEQIVIDGQLRLVPGAKVEVKGS